MNKNLFLIESSERERILGLHIKATKNQYLLEQADPTQNPIYQVFYTKLGDRSKRIWEGSEKGAPKMTPDEKNQILNKVKERVDKRVNALTSQGKKGISFDKELKDIESIAIDYKTTTQAPKQQPQPVTVETPYKAVYPNVETNNPELQNFYLKDNEIIVDPEKRAKFDTMVKELKALIPENETIKEIHIKAGSTTSQVPTTYKGGAYKTIQQGQQNNIALATDRCIKIEEALTEIVNTVFPGNENKIILDQKQMKANNGPAYTEKERKYFFGTGKLDPAKKPEYDKLYGPYKGSYGSVMVITVGTTKQDIPVEGEPLQVNEWSVRVQWKVNIEKPKKSYSSKGGGGISVGGGKSPIACPAW